MMVVSERVTLLLKKLAVTFVVMMFVATFILTIDQGDEVLIGTFVLVLIVPLLAVGSHHVYRYWHENTN